MSKPAIGRTEPGHEQLTRKTTGGAVWLIAVRLITKGIDFLALLILARLLNPSDFGIIAIAMTLVYIVEAVLEMPIYQVLVSLERIEQKHLDTAFTLSALRGVVLALVLAALALPFSHFYADDRIALLIAILSLAPAMRGMASPRLAVFAKRLDFRPEFGVELISKTASFLLSTSAAWIFRDYRALMIGVLATPATIIISSYALAPYRPRISFSAWPYFAKFLSWTTASQLLSALNWQCDRLILGRFVSRAEIGAFSLANDLSYIPEQALVRPILRPLMSAFALIRNDPERLRHAYAKTANTVLAIGLPVMLEFSMLAGPTIRLALGGKWTAAVPVLQWLSLTLIPPLFVAPFGSLAMALGKPDAVLRQTITEAVNKLPLVIGGAALYGVSGVVTARAVSALVSALIVLFFVRQLIGTPVLRQICDAWRVAASGAVLVVVLLVMRPVVTDQSGLALGALLAAVSGMGLAAYASALALLWHVSGRPSGFEHSAAELVHKLLQRSRFTFGRSET